MDATEQQICAKAEDFVQAREYVKALDLFDLLLARNPDNVHYQYSTASLYSELG